ALESILKAVDAFKQMVLIDPERQLDPNRVSPKAYSAFDVALRQVLLVRQLRIDSTSFVAGQGAVPIRFMVTQPARVVTRAIGVGGVGGGGGGGGAANVLVDPGAWNGQGNLSWSPRLPNGAPVPARRHTVALRRPAPRPAEGNILYNRLLTEQIARRNADIAKENVARRQQVQLTIGPSLKTGAPR